MLVIVIVKAIIMTKVREGYNNDDDDDDDNNNNNNNNNDIDVI